MSTLIEELPARIARLEAKHGPNDPFVKDLKEQLRASLATQGKSTQDVFRMQAVQFEKTPTKDPSAKPETETEADAIKAEALRRSKARRMLQAHQGRTKP